MSEGGTPGKLVKACYSFKGSNNDELNFSKGDVVTVTQMVDGGWWEGTLKGLTGWFPSNYVKEMKHGKQDARAGAKSPVMKPGELVMNKRQSMLFYHNVVLQSLIDTERTFVHDLQSLLQTYLRPLRTASIISSLEYNNLCGNLEDLAAVHQLLLGCLDECSKLPILQQKVGGVFIHMAPKLQAQYTAYCANHPTAAALLQTHKDELSKFMEDHGATPPGVTGLTTSLSQPFTRLNKYPNLLKELERHTEESHPDRGDTQRAISVYREIANLSTETRKQRELEYDIMHSAIKGWEGEDISKLGGVLLLSNVRVHSENGEKKERLFLLFHGLLVMLSVTPRMSQYIFEGKLPVSGMTVNPLDDTESYSFAFEITGSMIDRRVVSCGAAVDKKQWIDVLRMQAKLGPVKSPKPQSLQISTSQPSVSTLSSRAKHAQVAHTIPRPTYKTAWSMSCLRPCPPLRPSIVLKDDVTRSPRSGRRILASKRKVDDTKVLEDDAEILKVIESYCTSAKTRHTVNSLDLTKIRLTPMEMKNRVSLDANDNLDSLLDCPQVLIAEEEKIIVEETKGGQTIVEEKTLVDTVYSLKDMVKDISKEQHRLRKELEEEKRSRKRLENMLRKSLRSLVETAYHDESQAT